MMDRYQGLHSAGRKCEQFSSSENVIKKRHFGDPWSECTATPETEATLVKLAGLPRRALGASSECRCPRSYRRHITKPPLSPFPVIHLLLVLPHLIIVPIVP